MKNIYFLNELNPSDISIAGGKGANLGELIKHKIPVPNGFVLSTQTFLDFVDRNGINATNDSGDENKNYEQVKKSFTEGKIENSLLHEIQTAYNKIGSVPVAVRSSATAEDLPNTAFAGQQETYLNVVGFDQLLQAIKNTWASLWTPRAIAYRKHHEIQEDDLAVAVIVQSMVDAEFAGVMFTANPINGNTNQVVINASPGLGESVVSGATTPDEYVLELNRSNWEIKSFTEGSLKNLVTTKPDGGLQDLELANRVSLSDNSILKLAKIGKEIEKIFAHPQDIEWTIANNEIQIVQSRPITTLPRQTKQPNRQSKMLASMLFEALPERPKPLEFTLMGPTLLLDKALRPFLKSLGIKIPFAADLFDKEDSVYIKYNGSLYLRPSISILLTPIKILWLALANNPKDWKDDKDFNVAINSLKKIENTDLSTKDSEELLNLIQISLQALPTVFEIRLRYFPRVILATGFFALLLKPTRKFGDFGTLLFSGINTIVTQTNHILEDLAVLVKNDNDLLRLFNSSNVESLLPKLKKEKKGQEFLKRFYEFLDEYGYRETGGTLQLSKPTWKESPETVLRIIVSMLKSNSSQVSPPDWKETRDKIINQSYLRFWPFRQLFTNLLEVARYFHVFRENSRFYAIMPLYTLRLLTQEIGNRLKDKQILIKPEDLYYLSLEEVQKILLQPDTDENWQEEIEKRKQKMQDIDHIPFIPSQYYQYKSDDTDAWVSGTGASSGIVTGFARIINSSEEFDSLKPGEILVAPYTNPSWTPLFERAVAVIVDKGGIVSHAAIVAREYGIPAVMGTGDGTKKIKTGDRIQVDGSTGVVSRLNE